MHKKPLTSEEFELAIVNLLEERPNEEKPKRRRRNKEKDLMKKALRNEAIITEKMVQELVGVEKLQDTIEYVKLSYKPVNLIIGVVSGWYDDIKEIASYYDLEPKDIRLTGDYESDWTTVIQKGYALRADFYDKDYKIITYRGYHQPNFYPMKLLADGVYDYDEKIIDILNRHNLNPPKKVTPKLRMLVSYVYDADKIMALDKGGKYKKYYNAIKQYGRNNFWGDTIPYEKGDIVGTRNKLISALNHASKYDIDLNEDYMQRRILDYEFSHYDIVYEWVW